MGGRERREGRGKRGESRRRKEEEEVRLDPGEEETGVRLQTVKLQMGKMINIGKCDNLPGGRGVEGRRRQRGGCRPAGRQTDRQVQDGQLSVEEETVHFRGSR